MPRSRKMHALSFVTSVVLFLALAMPLAVLGRAQESLQVPTNYYDYLRQGDEVALIIRSETVALPISTWFPSEDPLMLEKGGTIMFQLQSFILGTPVNSVSQPGDQVARGDLVILSAQGDKTREIENVTSTQLGVTLNLFLGNWTGGFLATSNWTENHAWCKNSIDPNSEKFRVDDTGYSILLEKTSFMDESKNTSLVFERRRGFLLKAQTTVEIDAKNHPLVLEFVDAKRVPGIPLVLAGGSAIIGVIIVMRRKVYLKE